MFNTDELNEVASLLHIASEIMTNHPNMASIARACQRRLSEIDEKLKAAEAKEVEDNKKTLAEKQAADYKAPKPGDADYIEPEKEWTPNSNAEIERRV